MAVSSSLFVQVLVEVISDLRSGKGLSEDAANHYGWLQEAVTQGKDKRGALILNSLVRCAHKGEDRAAANAARTLALHVSGCASSAPPQGSAVHTTCVLA